jgi:hypothetical protein
MRQSISTKYLGATNHRGSRVKARSSSGLSLSMSWNDALGTDDNHRAAAEALARKLNWSGRWIAGGAADGRGNVYVWDDGEDDGFTVGQPRALYHVAVEACEAAIAWSEKAQDHGGNPECKDFVRLARKALGK